MTGVGRKQVLPEGGLGGGAAGTVTTIHGRYAGVGIFLTVGRDSFPSIVMSYLSNVCLRINMSGNRFTAALLTL